LVFFRSYRVAIYFWALAMALRTSCRSTVLTMSKELLAMRD
jgi:hypothetical protein